MYRKLATIAFSLLLFGVLAVPKAKADDTVRINTNAPVEVPGRVLPAGHYVFRFVDQSAGNDLIGIYGANGRFYEFAFVIPDYRTHLTGSKVVLEEEPNAPERIEAWFYPGSRQGFELLYPATQPVQLAGMKHPTATHSAS